MPTRSRSKRSRNHLKHLIEEIVTDECRLAARGLLILVDEIDVSGRLPERIRVWATFHFLPLGSPFCCMEPGCHLWLFGDRAERVNDALRRRLGLRQNVSVEFVCIRPSVHADVEFDDLFQRRCPTTPECGDIDLRDRLGRTALMRAAMRGHADVVEELLIRGANPFVIDHSGQGILERVPKTMLWITTLLQDATAERRSAAARSGRTE